ncbi:MAG TPA: SDR family oxidoreductase [Bryobacteraceae bacterium]|jgi:3-oxoacyl-[acyl-carrier protein] reductase|nr:SDR family oxidoreductase [Bryobacteraceae bacterium]
MPFSLKGKTALVTGSGRGIGRAIALQLAEAGAAVMLNDIDREPLLETGGLIDAAGGAAKALPGDITAPDFPQKLVDFTVNGFGSIDIIVNNAGYTWDNVIQKMTDEQFQAMLDIHMIAPFRIMRAASGYIREAAKKEIAEGRRVMRKVVNITSVSGVDGIAGQAGYGAGKAGINGLTKVMAKEWGRYNVNVNSVGFGFIETRLVQSLDQNATIDIKGRQIRVGIQPAAREAVKTHCPLGRAGTPEEAAGAVLFFCSPLSDYVSGEILIVSGGARS